MFLENKSLNLYGDDGVYYIIMKAKNIRLSVFCLFGYILNFLIYKPLDVLMVSKVLMFENFESLYYKEKQRFPNSLKSSILKIKKNFVF